jgi:cytoskeletal protein RodZ
MRPTARGKGHIPLFEIGSSLREARVRRSLTLQQVEEDTKIRVKYLQAMENEDFDLMPGPTYAKAFLRTYSTYLGLDATVMIQEYGSRVAHVRDHEPFGGVSMLGKPHAHRGRNTLLFVAVVCLLVLAVLVVLGREGGDATAPPTKPSALGLVSPSPSRSPTATPSQSATAAAAGDEVRVSAAEGDCWLEVRRGDAGGRVLFAATLKEGATKVFQGKTIWLRIGNPPALRINVGGTKIPPIDETGPLDYVASDGKLIRQD